MLMASVWQPMKSRASDTGSGARRIVHPRAVVSSERERDGFT